jgi:formylglycine-generating enzyme required for sulfatase activity
MGVTPAGVHDLAGNVWEWCRDWYGKYDNQESIDPSGPKKGSARVLRGGSFLSLAPVLRATSRVNYLPEYVRGNFGFRVVWVLAGGQK